MGSGRRRRGGSGEPRTDESEGRRRVHHGAIRATTVAPRQVGGVLPCRLVDWGPRDGEGALRRRSGTFSEQRPRGHVKTLRPCAALQTMIAISARLTTVTRPPARVLASAP